jgi:hypothetical protein
MNESLAYQVTVYYASWWSIPLSDNSGYCTILYCAVLYCITFATSCCWITVAISYNNGLSVVYMNPTSVTAPASFLENGRCCWIFLGDPAETGDIYSIRTKVAFLWGKTRLHLRWQVRRDGDGLASPSTGPHTGTRTRWSKAVRCRGYCRDRRWDMMVVVVVVVVLRRAGTAPPTLALNRKA